MNGDWFLELGQGLAHPLHRRWWTVGLNRGPFDHRQGYDRVRLGELKRDVVPGRRSAMFSGQGQLRAFAAQIEIGVTPAMKFARTAQGLARATGVGVFAGVMDQ